MENKIIEDANIEVAEDFNLSFTGKATLIVELEKYGPMEFRINDKDVLLKLMDILLDESNSITEVNAYDDNAEKTFRNILNDIPWVIVFHILNIPCGLIVHILGALSM